MNFSRFRHGKMIMTHTEEVSTTFESKTPAEQMNGHSMTVPESSSPAEAVGSRSSPSEDRHADGTSVPSVLEMGSTDSAGNGHGGSNGGPSCGLVSSLFPSSCRGRAEAFARRLHRRLTSLGAEDPDGRDPDASKPKETSWLYATSNSKPITVSNANTNHVLQRQPRHSPETDLYYDFGIDLEEDGLGSPAEEATPAELADLLVNPGILKTNRRDGSRCSASSSKAVVSNQDPESGCVFASPITGTSPESDTSEIYFDPESSETEKSKNSEVYFDPVSTPDSEITSNLSNLSNGLAVPQGNGILPCRKRLENSVAHSEDTTDSSCSLRRENHCDKQRRQDELVGSSEDSLNGRSSLETTSPSHESLWSTFDESTVSLQDDSPTKIGNSILALQSRLPKSHSDSEIPVNGSRIVIACGLARRDEETENGDIDVDEVDFVNGAVENGKSDEDIRNMINIAKEESPEYSDDTVEDVVPSDNEEPKEPITSPSKYILSLKVEETITSDTDTDHSTYSSTINIPGALTLECSTGERVVDATLKNEVQLQIENGAVLNGSDDDKMCLLLNTLSTSPSIKPEVSIEEQGTQKDEIVEEEEDEEEEEEERPQKVRRCSSLKTGKTPPGTPGRKKIVRFADVLGLDLADVRTFLDEIPKVPNSAYSDLIYDDIFQKDSSPVPNSVASTWGSRYVDSRRGSGTTMPRKLDRTLVPLFQQPGGMPNFLDLVRERYVCLENVLVQDPVSLCIQGTVRVINLDFHKSVHIRYTLNSWRNFSDLQATYVSNSCDGFSDKFSFVLYCHTLVVGQRLEFAVRFHCKGTQYWDNNAGANYCFQCLPTSSAVGYIPITAAENQPHEWSPMFY